MPDEIISRVSGLPPESLILFLFITVLRPLGLLFGFMAFSWGMGASFMVRAGVGFSIGLPMSVAGLDQIAGLIERNSLTEMIIILPKEVIIGFALGLLASFPFFALKAAGDITDTFRGESNSGHTDPGGGHIPTWSIVFLLIGFFAFFASGGLWQLIALLYQSYVLWPLTAPLPPLSTTSASQLAQLVTPLRAILIAAPLLILLVAVEFILIIAARTAQRFQLYSNDFTLKNLAAMLALPLMVLYVDRIADYHVFDSLLALPLLREFLP